MRWCVVGAMMACLALIADAQDKLVFEAEDYSAPSSAWLPDKFTADHWNLWSTDKDADKKWSGGVVLQSPVVQADRSVPEEGAPVLHTVLTGIPSGLWSVSVKYGRGLAFSLDGQTWINLATARGQAGDIEVTDGTLSFWVDDRFADADNPGSCYYDYITLTRVFPTINGVMNGDFEEGESPEICGWSWWSRDEKGAVSFVTDAQSGALAARVQYDGSRDWAWANKGVQEVAPGQIWQASAWVKCLTPGACDLTIRALSGDAILHRGIGLDTAPGGSEWVRLEAAAVIPPGCDRIQVCLIGRATDVLIDNAAFQEIEQLPEPRPRPITKPLVSGWAQTRVEENIDRGLAAMPLESGGVYVGWRLLRSDAPETAFNVYRRVGQGDPVRLNPEPLGTTTDFVDNATSADTDRFYWVCAVNNGEESAPSHEIRVAANAPALPYLSFRLDGNHDFQKAGIADLNGDGVYDFVLKQPNTNIDPYEKYWKRSEDTYKIEAYLADGTFLWRKDLGWAIERGIWYSPYLVYDFDGDGRAEVAVKTGEGDPRDADGRVYTDPEYLSIWDGMTGEERTRVDWPSREGLEGAELYNLASRNQMGVAYLDGKTPCLLVARGTYSLMKLTAYQYREGRLDMLWHWESAQENGMYHGQGAHFMHSGDVDGDGRDEVILGSCVIDDNGQGLWSTWMGHPDHCCLGDVDPARSGLEIYYGIESRQLRNGVCLADARTGEIIWGTADRTYHVHGAGLCSDIDPAHPGSECFSGERDPVEGRSVFWMHAADGTLLASEDRWGLGLSPRAVYWDADPCREVLTGKRIWSVDSGEVHLESVEGSGAVWADLLGDWREEIVVSVPGELRIYTTTVPAADRRVCLMQDPIYRADVAHLAMGYPQPPMLSYCIGAVQSAVPEERE